MSGHLLVIRFGAMGDLLHVSPSFGQLAQYLPQVKVTLLTAPVLAPLGQAFKGVSDVVGLSPKAPLADWWRLANRLRQQGITGIINLQPSIKTRLLALRVGAPVLGIYQKQKPSVLGQVGRQQRNRWHAVQNFYEAIRLAYPETLPELSATQLAPQLNLQTADLSASSKKELPVNCPMVALVLGVGRKRPNRAWPLGHYKALLNDLLAAHPSWHITLIGGIEDAPLAIALLSQLSQSKVANITNYCGQLTLLETAQQLTQATCVLGGDTGPMHLAAALGQPCIGLFAPTSVHRTGLLTTTSTLEKIIHLTPPEALACWPCEKAVCLETSTACIGAISPLLVLQAVEQLLAPVY
jgi:lipopolysaccharide heptosyltransferase II